MKATTWGLGQALGPPRLGWLGAWRHPWSQLDARGPQVETSTYILPWRGLQAE